MAQQQMSLFGPTPDEVRAARLEQQQQRGEDRFAANIAAFKGDLPGVATGYALGGNVGRGLTQAARGLFGQEIEDPLLEKSILMESITKEFEGLDFNDPGTLQKVAGRLQEAGLYNEAMNVFDRSLAISTKMAELGAKTKKNYNNLSLNDITKITSLAENVETTQEFLDTWDDAFVNPMHMLVPRGGDIQKWLVDTVNIGTPEAQARANWWRNYQSKKNKVRNALFGGALTPTEKEEFEKADIDLNIRNPETIKANLRRQADLANKGWSRLTKALEIAGYDPSIVNSLTGNALDLALKDQRVTDALEEQTKKESEFSTQGPLKAGYVFEEGKQSGIKPIFSDSYENFK